MDFFELTPTEQFTVLASALAQRTKMFVPVAIEALDSENSLVNGAAAAYISQIANWPTIHRFIRSLTARALGHKIDLAANIVSMWLARGRRNLNSKQAAVNSLIRLLSNDNVSSSSVVSAVEGIRNAGRSFLPRDIRRSRFRRVMVGLFSSSNELVLLTVSHLVSQLNMVELHLEIHDRLIPALLLVRQRSTKVREELDDVLKSLRML